MGLQGAGAMTDTTMATGLQTVGLAARLLAALPQTQCTRCGYVDCAAYANAVAADEAEINQCPPGGAQGIARLAELTGRPVRPLNLEHGSEAPRGVAVIDEAWCIGCTLCIKVCPTDAIFGSHKLMHAVIEPCCTGCELCLPVCPVDCIQMVPVTGTLTGWAAWSGAEADLARHRYAFHSEKIKRDERSQAETPVQHAQTERPERPEQTQKSLAGQAHTEADRKRRVIVAAVARARDQRASNLPPPDSD